jgi:formyltetrahydrofolate deformylase
VVQPAGEHVLTLSCADRRGIVHAVTGALLGEACNILDSQQFGDPDTGRFFMRVHFAADEPRSSEALAAAFAPIGDRFEMAWHLHDLAHRPRILIMVSRLGHCLNDLLYRQSTGALRADVAAVVSNHADFAGLARTYDVPFHHVPVTPASRDAAEGRLLELVDELDVELVVLARYMQVLGPATSERLAGRAINIHHSFLPSFRGARPYEQAHARGVKLIGATAHYISAELDEGPIIEQGVERVDHTLDAAGLAAVGRDVECVTLARAVIWHLEHRVLLNGDRTVVLR